MALGEATLCRYLNGKCDVFAYALWLAHERRGAVRIYAGGKGCHMYYVHRSGRLIDVSGICTDRTARRRWRAYSKIDDYEPRHLWHARQAATQCVSRNGGHVTQALRVIRGDPRRYLLRRN
jgi:hypothetical protein